MKIKELLQYIESWAPPGIAWIKDNVGLQVGDTRKPLKKILICLDCTEAVVQEAIRNKCTLILSHHPLLFFPLKNLNLETRIPRIVQNLLKHSISLVSYHTNLDFTHGGINTALAEKLYLLGQKFLEPLEEKLIKIVVFVPSAFSNRVREGMFAAGAGVIGEYQSCSFTVSGTGSFTGSDKSNPTIGEKGVAETVSEERIEVIAETFRMNSVLSAMRAAHPYEEPAFDVYPLINRSTGYGAGMIGYLETPILEEDFLEYVKTALAVKCLRYSAGKNTPIRVVAVCGGSGSSHLKKAIAEGADAFITSDITYHTFQEAEGKILLIDAGHFETERTVLPHLKEKIESFLEAKRAKVSVSVSELEQNPVRYF